MDELREDVSHPSGRDLRSRRSQGKGKNAGNESVYARSKKSCSSNDPKLLNLHKDDIITSIKKDPNQQHWWEGKNERTGQIGLFHEGDVNFFSGSPGILESENLNSSDHNSPSPTARSSRSEQPSSNGSSLSVVRVVWCVLIMVVLGVCASRIGIFKRTRKPANITEIKQVFRAQDSDMWDVLQAGLLPSTIETTKTFLFVHAKNGRTVECLIKTLSDNYCDVYRASHLHTDEDFVSQMKDSLTKQKCMVIYDIENLSKDGIALLKGFCDAYTPIVEGAEFYFAFDTKDPPVDANVQKVARQKLETIWFDKNYSSDEFGGTLTRLTQNVLRVIDEDQLPC